MQIQELEPQALWRNFADLNAVPRASKKEERVIAFTLVEGAREERADADDGDGGGAGDGVGDRRPRP